MRKFLIGLLIVVLGVGLNTDEANAKTFNWEDFAKTVAKNWQIDSEADPEKNYIVYDENSMDVAMNQDGLDISVHIDYDSEKKIIKYQNTRNLENENDANKIAYYAFDNVLLLMLETSLVDYYEIEVESLEEISKIALIGTTTIEGETLTYEETTENGTSKITATEIKSYEKDINKLENYINNNSQTTTTTTTTKEPTTTTTKTTTITNQTNSTTNTQTTTIENPKTADASNQLYIIVGIIALVGITSLGIKFAKANR